MIQSIKLFIKNIFFSIKKKVKDRYIAYKFRPRRVNVSLFEIVENPIIFLSEVKVRRFYIVDRKPINECMNVEDSNIFANITILRDDPNPLVTKDEKQTKENKNEMY